MSTTITKNDTPKTLVRNLLRVGAMGLVLGWSSPVLAGGDLGKTDKKFSPGIEGEVTVEFQSDHTFSSDDPNAKISDTYKTTEIGLGWYFTRNFSAHGTFVFEPVLDATGDRFFEDHGLYAEELYAKIKISGVSFVAGKFNPAFGAAWDAAPELYGTDLAENYELTERVGLSLSTKIGKTALGDVTLTASTYYLDKSALSNSIFTKRGRTTLADGGVSNTGELDSFAIAVEGSNIPGFAGLTYNLGYRYQEAGTGDAADEKGYVFGLQGEVPLGGVTLQWIGEVAYLENAEGTINDQVYYTVGGNFKFSKYELALSYTGISNDIGPDDQQIQVSASTEIHRGWGLSVGYKYHEEDGVDNHTAGIKLDKTFSFSTRK